MGAFNVPKPCENCPFLREGGIRLRRARIREIAGGMLDQQGAVFDCHKTTVYSDEAENMVRTSKSLHCAGALIFAEKNENATQMMRIAERIGQYDAEALMSDKATVARVFDTLPEMLATALDRPTRRTAMRPRKKARG